MSDGDPSLTRERLAALGEIAAEIAHELRNALQVIATNAYLARQDPAGSASQLATIEKNARLAQTIVDDLLGLARGDGTITEATPLVDVILAARSDLPTAAAEWNDQLAPGTLSALLHRGLSARLLHVLYENAIAASSPRTPRIATRAWAAGECVFVEVVDDGPGIPAALGARVFEPLVSARPGGTGLGLTLAKRIAAAQSGTLELLASSELGSGAAFRITFQAVGGATSGNR